MKHLKKLSVALLATTLFSVSFTSCIDNEVSPIVEAIYEAQADLIAAQAKVQDAEAGLLAAQAAQANAQATLLTAQAGAATKDADGRYLVAMANAGYTDAQATALLKAADGNYLQAVAAAGFTDAQAAKIIAETLAYSKTEEQKLLALIQTTAAAVEASKLAVLIAKEQFNIDMKDILRELALNSGVTEAVGYAYQYQLTMNRANDILDDKFDAQQDLAEAMIMANSVYSTYAMDNLELVVENAKLQVNQHLAEIAQLQALLDDPNSLPAKVTAWQKELVELEKARDLKESEYELVYQAAENLISGGDGADDIRDDKVAAYEGYQQDSLDLMGPSNGNTAGTINFYKKNIAANKGKLATYAADLAAAKAAKTAAENAYKAVLVLLGEKEGATTIAFGNYFTKDSKGVALPGGKTKYATPANYQQTYVNTRIDLTAATAAYNDYDTAFQGLVVSYNNAVTALAAAQLAYDNADYAGDLATATADQALVAADLAAAQATYNAAKTAFEADPTGSVNADGVDAHALAQIGYGTMDLGQVGIHTDLAPDTYMRVDTWKETFIGSGEYVPASFYPTKYNTADLAVHIAAIKASAVAPNTNITVDSDIWVWEATGAGAMEIVDGGGVLVNPDDHALTAGQALSADTDNLAVFVNVELDDTSVSNEYTFNVATNMYGTNNFSSRPFFTSGAGTIASPYVFNAVLVSTDAGAGYDSTPDALTGKTSPAGDANNDMLTAQAEMWNAKLETFKKQNAADLGSAGLQVAQDAYDFQKELFDNGVANLAALKTTMDNADDANDDAKKMVDDTWTSIGIDYAAGTSAGPLKWYASKTGYTVDASAGYDNDFKAPLSSNTLTSQAVIYNAEVALAKLEVCDAACLAAAIASDEHEMSLKQIVLDGINVILAATRAEYNQIMLTFIDGWNNLDADLQAAYNAEMYKATLIQYEIDALDAQIDFINGVLNNINDDNLSDVSLQLELKLLYQFGQGTYIDALADLKLAEENLAAAQANADTASNAAYMAYLQGLIDTLDSRYTNALALAAKYKALMEAALAS